MSKKEEWRDVVGYEGLYQVSDRMRIRSVDRIIEKMGSSGKLVRMPFKGGMKLPYLTNRRPSVALNKNGKQRMHFCHILVAEAFLGERPLGLYVLHGDDDKLNWNRSNLRYGTHQENTADAMRNGCYKSGESTCKAKISRDTAVFIKSACLAGYRSFGIRDVCGASYGIIINIRIGHTWKQISPRELTPEERLRLDAIKYPPTSGQKMDAERAALLKAQLPFRIDSYIARDFGLSSTTVRAIRNGEKWKNTPAATIAQSEIDAYVAKDRLERERRYGRKLNAEQVAFIKSQLTYRSDKGLAREYGTTPQIIKAIRKGKSWPLTAPRVLSEAEISVEKQKAKFETNVKLTANEVNLAKSLLPFKSDREISAILEGKVSRHLIYRMRNGKIWRNKSFAAA